MIQDKEVMLHDVAFNEDGVIDLGPYGGSSRGTGEVILIHVSGKNLAVDGGEDYKVVVTGSHDDTSYFAEMEVQMGLITAMNGGITFGLSSAVTRYVKLALSGYTAGTWRAAVVLKHYV